MAQKSIQNADREPGQHLLSRGFGRLLEGLNAAGTVMILGLMILINFDVLGRNLLDAPVPGVIEITEVAIVVIVFLQAAHTLRQGRMLQSDGTLLVLRNRYPRVGATMDMLINILGLMVFLALAYAMSPRVSLAWENNLYKGNLGGFTVPIWPLELAILVGSALTAAQFAINALAAMRIAFRSPKNGAN